MTTRVKLFVVLFVFLAGFHRVNAQGTAFTYQGRLNDGGTPANGSYDLRFIVYNSDVGGSQQGPILTNTVTSVSNGLFTVTLDFGNVFDGSPLWLETYVRTNNSLSFTRLDPRQPLTPAPYAIMAGNLAPGAGLSGTYGNAVTFSNANNSFSGNFIGNGGGITNVHASTLGGLSAMNFWTTAGNPGTSPSNGNFLGTIDNQPLELRVNGMRAMRYEFGSNTNAAPNLIGGSPVNFVSPGVVGAVIAGGGTTNFNNAGHTNSVSANFAAVGGGSGNSVQGGANFATISGGADNQIQSNAFQSTIGGGFNNSIQTNAFRSTIGGGLNNSIQIDANDSTVAGGTGNTISIGANSATIGGGVLNIISTDYATIGGGRANVASGIGSYIGGGGFDGSTTSGNTIAANDGVIGGGMQNQILVNARLSVIGGGHANLISSSSFNAVIVGGEGNFVNAPGAVIGGGGYDGVNIGGNTNLAKAAVIGGGMLNSIFTMASYASIGGGNSNGIAGDGISSAIGGGAGNRILRAISSTIGGGQQNHIQLASFSTISGGSNNMVSGNFGIIPGGDQNMATTNAFAAGHRAQAIDQGSFVWADATEADFSDSGTNTFNVRASGGVTFTDGAGNSVSWTPGATSWTFTNDQNAKENLAPVKAQEMSSQPAFPLNAHKKMLNRTDEAGVALAAIQGLNQKLEQKETEITELKARLDKLEQLLNSKVKKGE